MNAKTRDMQNDFAELMQRASLGDRDAQSEICQHYEPKVRVVARVLLGPALRTHFDSLDLVQSVHRSLLVGLRNEKFDISTPEKLMHSQIPLYAEKLRANGDGLYLTNA